MRLSVSVVVLAVLLAVLATPLSYADEPGATAPSTPEPGVVTLEGPDQVVDGRSVILVARWVTESGRPVQGPIKLQRRVAGVWRTEMQLATTREGIRRITLWPRDDSRWRVVAVPTEIAEGATSNVHYIDNLPPGEPVTLPESAPEPRIRLPRQQRAVGPGANPAVTRIPNGVWGHMRGRSWHEGCPVGRDQLRLLRINYWGYDGYRYRGEVVARADSVEKMTRALADMYRGRYPIRAMYRVDRFGWSRRLQGADDYASMAAGNTSAFNCRWVVGRPGVRSPHSYGRSLDVNPWENPYRSSDGWVPNNWWVGRSHPLVAWRSSDHPVVRLMTSRGLRWTYGVRDAHHFDAAGSGRISARELHPQCDGLVCE